MCFRPSTPQDQVHCGHKLDRDHLPGREGAEAAGALLPRSHGRQHHQVEEGEGVQVKSWASV